MSGKSIDSPGVPVRIRRLSHGEDLPLPQPATADAAGFDLRACVDDAVRLAPGERRLVPTALAIALPVGFEAQVRPRSGLAIRHGVTLLNSPGTIDADYRGEIGVIVINHGEEPFEIQRGDRIAQLVVQQVAPVRLLEVDELPVSDRGSGGFGHTGRR